MEFRDYYATLGVPRGASDKEIRSSYRKLARELHPDVNKDPHATERFKRVNEAYEVLKDPEKRAKYDRLGSDWEQLEKAKAQQPRRAPQPAAGGAGPANRFGGFSDFFETFFGGRGSDGDPRVEAELERLRREQNAPRKGPDTEHGLEVTLAEAVSGGARELDLTSSDPCPTCQGSGQVRATGSDGGTAVSLELRTCPTCHGSGVQTHRRSLRVTIPRGVTEGSRIRVAGEGGAGANGGPRGDLYLRAHLTMATGTEVRGRDVHTELPVRDYRAALGGEVATSGPTGRLQVTVPPGCPPGRILRVPGKGIPPIRDGGKAGDLYLRVRLTGSPRSPLPEPERRAYQELEQADRGKA